ncbi:interferon gamma receptor 1 [Polymixia lowei]
MKVGTMLDTPGQLSILIFVASVSAIVPPPQNVTVSCQNFQTIVYWNYSEQLQTSFRLNMSGYIWYETEEHKYDLTPFIWESTKRNLDFHYVKIAAVRGRQESKMVESPTFTFNDQTPANIKCKLDFPPVEMEWKDSEATVWFDNPLRLNKELKWWADATIHFTVLNDESQGQYEGTCTTEKTCICHFSALQSNDTLCVTLKGQISDGNGFSWVLFKDTDPICAQKPPAQETHLLIVAITLLIIGVAIIVVIMMICMKKTWVTHSSPEPKVLVFLHSNPENNIINLPDEKMSCIDRIEPAVDKLHSSLMALPEADPSETHTNSSGSDVSPTNSIGPMYMEGGLSESSSQEMEHTGLTSETHRSQVSNVEDSETVSIDSEGEEVSLMGSGYDRPHRLMDMGGGDMVKCYGPT